MHGSSSVPEELQEIINKYSGQMKPSWGVPVEEIERGIKNGVRNICIDADHRTAMTARASSISPTIYIVPDMGALTKVCKERLGKFGTAGQASPIQRLSWLRWPTVARLVDSSRRSFEPDDQRVAGPAVRCRLSSLSVCPWNFDSDVTTSSISSLNLWVSHCRADAAISPISRTPWIVSRPSIAMVVRRKTISERCTTISCRTIQSSSSAL